MVKGPYMSMSCSLELQTKLQVIASNISPTPAHPVMSDPAVWRECIPATAGQADLAAVQFSWSIRSHTVPIL